MYRPPFHAQKVENSEDCYANYIKAIAAVNKLLLENYYNELRAETFVELTKSLDAVTRTCSPWSPLWSYANWALSAVEAAKKPTRDEFMKLTPPPYRQGQIEVQSAFRRLMDDKTAREVREALLEAIRLTLHEPLQVSPLLGSSQQIDLTFEIGTQLSNLSEPFLTPGEVLHPYAKREKENYEETIERIVAEGIKRLRESYE